MDDETIEALFPRLDDLLDINGMCYVSVIRRFKAAVFL